MLKTEVDPIVQILIGFWTRLRLTFSPCYTSQAVMQRLP